MRKKFTLVAAATVLAAGGLVTAPAQAGETAPSANVIRMSKVHLVDGVPTVTGVYSCTGPTSHLWVSAKQGRGDLSQEGSGADARAWWQRTYDNRLKCNGQEHTFTARLRPTGDTGDLIPTGKGGRDAWVQFCLATDESDAGFDSIMQWRGIRRV
jgi:hypothetical protein